MSIMIVGNMSRIAMNTAIKSTTSARMIVGSTPQGALLRSMKKKEKRERFSRRRCYLCSKDGHCPDQITIDGKATRQVWGCVTHEPNGVLFVENERRGCQKKQH